jgi:hypothetical protein
MRALKLEETRLCVSVMITRDESIFPGRTLIYFSRSHVLGCGAPQSKTREFSMSVFQIRGRETRLRARNRVWRHPGCQTGPHFHHSDHRFETTARRLRLPWTNVLYSINRSSSLASQLPHQAQRPFHAPHMFGSASTRHLFTRIYRRAPRSD